MELQNFIHEEEAQMVESEKGYFVTSKVFLKVDSSRDSSPDIKNPGLQRGGKINQNIVAYFEDKSAEREDDGVKNIAYEFSHR